MIDVQLKCIGAGLCQLHGMLCPAVSADPVEAGDHRYFQARPHTLQPFEIMLFSGTEGIRYGQEIIRFKVPYFLFIQEMMQQLMVTAALFLKQAVHDNGRSPCIFEPTGAIQCGCQR